jgi:signal transduction histidine kinase
MNGELFATFPRVHTAIAEWLACLIYIFPRTKRIQGWKLWSVCAAFFGILLLTNMASEREDGLAWVLLMIACMAEMYLMIWLCCKARVWKALYFWAHAFIAAEFAASLEWQINCYIIYGGYPLTGTQTYTCMAAVYLLVFGLLWLLNRKGNLIRNQQLHTSFREALAAGLIALVMFTLSNAAFAFRDTVISRTMGAGVLFVRTLADLSGLIMLYAHDEQRREIHMRYELESMNRLLDRQYEQFCQAEANNEAMHRVYHDLKHQIAFIRAETDERKRESFLSELERVVSIHEAEVSTGNSVLDTILTSKNLLCVENGITMTCFADGSGMRFLDVMDLCSIFGNALDNAIEYEKKIGDPEKRLIKVTVYNQNRFLLIRIENYCEETIPLRDGLPVTTKKDPAIHGYGLKSIRHAAEKYGGSLNVTQEPPWFVLTVLIPAEGIPAE